ncbi:MULTISPECIES: ParB/RepB/Spo0J family partition protein [unclassified Streptomyces]|uniref:ParB/RepB/Spo0J family partition protein n=1 Tax=unclassified Streptomyces TaxID=2593676 RepID=UPI0033194A7C
MTAPQQRVTRGFSMDEEVGGDKRVPRRIRTRQQIMNGEGKRPPNEVELKLLVGNPFNPRDELTELEETAESLRIKQIQPVTVVRRAAFLNAYPGMEEKLGYEAEYVVIDGNRRLAAAQLADLAKLRIDVNDDLAATAADIVESALIANVHRVDVPPMDQAKAIQGLVEVHGSQGEVARRLGKTPAWVSQRLALLELTPELQKKVETGELKVEPARRIGRLPKTEQEAEATKAINAVKAPRQRRRRPEGDGAGATTVNGVNASADLIGSAIEDPASVNGVNTSDGVAGSSSDSRTIVNGVNTRAEDASATPNSEQSPGEAEGERPKRLPYDDAFYIVRHLHMKMAPEHFVQGARVWMQVLREEHPEEYRTLLLELGQTEQQSA